MLSISTNKEKTYLMVCVMRLFPIIGKLFQTKIKKITIDITGKDLKFINIRWTKLQIIFSNAFLKD